MTMFVRAGLSITLAIGSVAPVSGQPPKLPIAQGVWVKADTQCKAAFIAHVYTGNRFGTAYLYGPSQKMGPANETEPLLRIGKGKNGFTIVNEGPLEVAAGPKGAAFVRAVSLSEGVQWTETVRLCPAASLSSKFRSGLVREGLLTPARNP
jgi:hypothetical protein